MNVVKEIQKINELELQGNGQGSWHDDYKDSAHIFVGGLPFNLTEGDVIAIFSQYGEIGDINLPRDKETQKVRGFAFLMYLDQRSTVLAVDNLNGAKVLGRTLRVDHTKNYRQTKVLNEETGEMEDADEERMNALPQMTGGDGQPAAAAVPAIEPGDEEDPMAAYIRENKRARLEESAGSGSGSKSKEAKRAEKEAQRAEKEGKQQRKEAKRADKDGRRYGEGESSRRRHHHERDGRDARPSTSRRAASPPPACGDVEDSDRYRRRSTSARERERSPPRGAPAPRRRSPSPVRRRRSPPPRDGRGPSFAGPRHLPPSPDAPSRRYPAADDHSREHRDERAYGGRDDRVRDVSGASRSGAGRWDEREPARRVNERDRRY